MHTYIYTIIYVWIHKRNKMTFTQFSVQAQGILFVHFENILIVAEIRKLFPRWSLFLKMKKKKKKTNQSMSKWKSKIQKFKSNSTIIFWDERILFTHTLQRIKYTIGIQVIWLGTSWNKHELFLGREKNKIWKLHRH